MTTSKTPSAPAYTSEVDFLTHGLDATTLEQPLNCSICLEPLLTSATTNTTRPLHINNILPQVSIHDSTISAPLDEPAPEVPIHIRRCRHIFGRSCLLTWFDSVPPPNKCPECNIILFAPSSIHIALRWPTLASRVQFADCVEHVLHDVEGSEEIRSDLMSDRTTLAMREFTLELFRQQGWEVTWEYVDEEEGEEADMEEETRVQDKGHDQNDTNGNFEHEGEDCYQQEIQGPR